MEFVNHELAEVECRRLGLNPVYRNVPASAIDVPKSRQNRARPVSVIKEMVDDYAIAMKRGSVFPAIVLAKLKGSAKYVIAGGNHRHEAATINGCTEFRAIVVECNDTEFRALCPALNSIEGLRGDRAQRVAQAVDLVRLSGLKVADAAANMKVDESLLRSYLRSHEVRDKAADLGIVIPSAVSATALMNVWQHTKSAPLFKAVASYIAKRVPSTAEISELNTAISTATSEAGKLRLVQQLYESAETRRGPASKVIERPIRSQMMAVLSKIENLVEGRTVLSQLQLDEQDGKEVLTRWDAITKKLKSILING